MGEKDNVNVEVEIRTPNEEDARKQAEAIEALTSRGVDGIAISCSEVNTVTPSIDKAVSKGVALSCVSIRMRLYAASSAVVAASAVPDAYNSDGDLGSFPGAGKPRAGNLRLALLRQAVGWNRRRRLARGQLQPALIQFSGKVSRLPTDGIFRLTAPRLMMLLMASATDMSNRIRSASGTKMRKPVVGFGVVE